jgi:hypothetical protein
LSPAAFFALAVGAAPIELDPANMDDQLNVTVACDPAACSIAWDRNGGRSVQLQWIAPDGTLGTQTSTVGTAGALFMMGSVAWGTRRFFVVGPEGVGTDSSGNLMSMSSPFASIAGVPEVQIDDNMDVYQSDVGFAAGANYGLLAYVIRNAGGFTQIDVRRVLADGGLPDPASTLIHQGTNHVGSPRVVAQGGLFWVLMSDRIDNSQYDPYLSAFDETTMAPVVDHGRLLTTTDDERYGVLVGRGDHLLAGWMNTTTVVAQLARLPLDGGAATILTQLPNVIGVDWSWRGDAGVIAVGHLIDGGNDVNLDLEEIVEVADGGILLSPIWNRTITVSDQDNWALSHISDERIALAFNAVVDAGYSHAFAMTLGIRLLGEGCTSDAGCAQGICSGGVCAIPGTDAGTEDGGSPDAGTADGGEPDAGPLRKVSYVVRCGCNAGPEWALAAPLVLLRRRRQVTSCRTASSPRSTPRA